MFIRPFTLFDLLALGKYRRDLLTLDSARAVTRGNLLGLTALFPFFNPGQYVFTAIQENNPVSVMGQVTLMENESCARISFLAPGDALGEDETPFIEYLVMQAGQWNALYIMAEPDEHSPAFKALRKAGFAMYAWQKAWQLTGPGEDTPSIQWKSPSATEMISIQGLYTQIVPALLQPVDSMPRMGGGLICTYDDKIQMHATITSGSAGIWIQPLVHPDSACAADCLQALLKAIPNRGGKPVTICIRSYQAWLESPMKEMGAEPGSQQAVMVKHLAALQRDEAKVNIPEKAFVKPAAPITRSSMEK